MIYTKKVLYRIILKEVFGAQVAEVALCLFNNPYSHFKNLIENASTLKLSSKELSQCLATLYQHQLLIIVKSERNPEILEFLLDEEKILHIVLFPKFLRLLDRKSGKVHGVVLQELFTRGRDSMSSAIFHAISYLKVGESHASVQEVLDCFTELAVEKYIIPVEPFDSSEQGAISLSLPSLSPETQQKIAQALEEEATELPELPDRKKLWTVNLKKLGQDLRNDLVKDAAQSSIDSNAAEVLGLFLNLVDALAEKGKFLNLKNDEVVSQAQRRHCVTKSKFVDGYLQILAEDGFIQKVDGAVEGTYTSDHTKILEKLARAIVECAVLTLGKHSLRLFCAIEEYGLVSQETLYAKMILSKSDVNRRVAQLVRKGFVAQYDYRKINAASVKKIYWNPTLHKVEFTKVARTVLQRTYQALLNAKIVSQDVSSESEEILKKKDKLELLEEEVKAGIAENPENEESLQEIVRNYFTEEDEKEYHGSLKKDLLLNGVQLKLALDILILEDFLKAVTVQFQPRTRSVLRL
ncbi:uncharacterized protein LOC136037825 isoform X1 [Artemia franciscana]|uniref:DNA-directed RNA polymerase III subunit RPC3 n=2 Tax=Artemia franciscana TaxID=6661 RepID=A0AA88I5T1_ARTSF|nr:hypothetical protein QYM36_006014 [Artemia franciscana]